MDPAKVVVLEEEKINDTASFYGYIKSKFILIPVFLSQLVFIILFINFGYPNIKEQNIFYAIVSGAIVVSYLLSFPVYFAMVVKALLFLVISKDVKGKNKQMKDLKLFSALFVIQVAILLGVFLTLIPICGVLWCGYDG